jgi:hypothetical protein
VIDKSQLATAMIRAESVGRDWKVKSQVEDVQSFHLFKISKKLLNLGLCFKYSVLRLLWCYCFEFLHLMKID